MKIETLTGKTKEFSQACYDMNSLSELESGQIDQTSLIEWGLTQEQYISAIEAATFDLINCEF